MVELGIMKTQTEKIDKSILLNYTTIRKCTECKEYIQLEKFIKYEKVEDEFIYYKDKLFHCGCLKKKLKSKKIGRMSDEDIIVLIDGLRDESYNHAMDVLVRNHLYKYLMDHYDVIMLPTYIYTKMEQLFTGTYKNMTRPMKASHILDMFQRKQSQLDKIYHKEKLDGISRINYDLAVLIGKYNNYLEWIEKSKTDVVKTEEFIETSSAIELDKLIIFKKGNQKNTPKNIFEEEE